MALIFDIGISAEFWRRKYPLTRAPENPLLAPPLDAECSKAAVDEIAPSWAREFSEARSQPIDLLVFDNAVRRRSCSHRAYSWGGAVPEGSFYELKPGVYVDSPEFMFMRAATLLSLPSTSENEGPLALSLIRIRKVFTAGSTPVMFS